MTATPTETMRKATCTLAAAIVKAAVDGKEMPLPFAWPSKVPIDCPDCPVTDAEELIFQLAQEITLLTVKGDRSMTQETQNVASSWQNYVDAYPREEFLAAYREAHTTLHKLWTAAVGKEDYDKASWRTLNTALSRFARDAAEKVGIARSEPLLMTKTDNLGEAASTIDAARDHIPGREHDMTWDWRELTNHEREEAIDALVMATVEGEPVPEIRAAKCRCGREQVTPGPPFRLKFLSEHGWQWQLMQHVPLDFSGSAGAARWLCPACVREATANT